MSTPLTLSVKMSAVGISPQYLEDLASEYYGKVLHVAGSEPDDETIIEFAGESAPSHMALFKSGLDSFLIKP